ncbi:MAG: HNH endonuclease signature motif containing protein [Patescibacteria group bacterium]
MAKEKRKYADRAEYLKKAVDKRRKMIRKMAVEYKGKKCAICGYSKCVKALDLHHISPTEKDFGISEKGYTRSWERVKIELDKCIMLCANCHREIHEGITQLPQVIEVEKRGEIGEVLS